MHTHEIVFKCAYESNLYVYLLTICLLLLTLNQFKANNSDAESMWGESSLHKEGEPSAQAAVPDDNTASVSATEVFHPDTADDKRQVYSTVLFLIRI